MKETVMEILQGISCTLGVVLTVPIASFVAVEVLCKGKEAVNDKAGSDEAKPGEGSDEALKN